MKPKVLILLSNFLPGTKIGGPLASNINIIQNLGESFEFYIITSCHDIGEKKTYENIDICKWTKFKSYNVFYLPKGVKKLFELVKQIIKSDAEIIYINSFFDFQFSIIISILTKIRIFGNKKIIIAPRGEFVEGCLKFKATQKYIYIIVSKYLKIYKNVFWHASTHQEKSEILSTLKVKESKISIALNIPSIGSDLEINEIHKIDNKKLNLIFLSRISKEKNLSFALEILANIKRDVIFDIYGPIEDNTIWASCLKHIENMPTNVVINYKGIVNRDLVRNTFLKYDLFLFPSVGENYAHVIIESLLTGTQVLISDNTPWRHLQKDLLGWDINLSRKNDFIDVIENFEKENSISKSYEKRIKIRECIIKRLDFEKVINDNFKLFN